MRRSINSQDIHLLFNEFRKHYCPWTDIGEIRAVALFRDDMEALVMYWERFVFPCAYSLPQLKSAWQVLFE